ncbi:MAG: MerR family transcriptional regulator [Polyangiaceae bacterium]
MTASPRGIAEPHSTRDAALCASRGRSEGEAALCASRDRSEGEAAQRTVDTRAKPSAEVTLSVGELAKAAGTTLRTVRFYEEQGILLASERTLGHHRRFEASELLRLRIVLELRGAGLSLDEIRAMTAIRQRSRVPGCAARELAPLLEHQVTQVEEKIALFVSIRQRLRRAQDCLSTCSTCKDTSRFSTGCEGCEVLETAGPTGDLFRLLWSEDP